MRLRHHFLATLALKFAIAAVLPLFADEAYYVFWARHLSGGYYDLPPMVAWWLAPFAAISTHPVWLRLPGIFLTTFLAWVARQSLRSQGRLEEADRAAIHLLWNPFLLLPVIVSTDTPFVCFWVLSLAALQYALRSGPGTSRNLGFLFSGMAAGAAFLAKYFAGLLAPIFLLSALGLAAQRRPSPRELLIWTLGGLPFLAQHLEWNSRNCWVNLVFNLNTRHGVATEGTFTQYLAFVAILSLPLLPLLIPRATRQAALAALRSPANRVWSAAFFFPLFAFGASALSAPQGFHWLFAPFFSLYLLMGTIDSRGLLRFNQVISVAATAVILALATMPDSFFREKLSGAQYRDYVVFRYPKEVLAAIAPHRAETDPLLTDSYSISAVLDAARSSSGQTGLFTEGSKFGRQFDFHFRPEDFAGRALGIFFRSDQASARFEPYFERVSVHPVRVREADLTFVLGEGFRPEPYRADILGPALARYYPPIESGLLRRWERGCPLR